jgi:hypothetical protein
MPIEQIISGGQSGVDRAALDVGRELGIECGGWCPLGRRAEDGVIPDHYPLRETPTADYEQRTEWNVWESDGTLVLTVGPVGGGTGYTVEIAEAVRRPHLVIDISELAVRAAYEAALQWARNWIESEQVAVLNVAGPRESKCPGVYASASEFLRRLLQSTQE